MWLGIPLAMLLVRQALTGQFTLVGADLFLFNLPQFEALERAWRGGGVPGWSPLVGHGQPFLADLCFAAHYPLHAVVLLASAVGALAWFYALHVVIAHAGAYRLARTLGVSPLGAALAGLVYAGGGGAQSFFHNPAPFIGMTWTPWAVLLAQWALARAPAAPWRLALAAAPFALAFLGGAPEFAALAGALAWLFAARAVGPLRATLGLAVVALFALALSASTLVPFIGISGDTDRAAGLDYEMASRWSVSPPELAGIVLPQLFDAGGFATTTFALEGRPWHHSLYHGAAPAALLGLGLVAARRDRRARFLVLAALPFLLYALGRHLPLHRLLFDLLPPIRSVRYPAKALVPVLLCLALLAGLGLDRARAAPRALVAALACVLGLALLGATAAALADHAPLAWRAAATAAAASIALAVVRWRPGLRRAGQALVVLALLDLALASRSVYEVAPAAIYEAPPALAPHVRPTERVAPLASALRLRGVDAPDLGPMTLGQRSLREGLLPNTGLSAGVRVASGFSSFVSKRLLALRAAAGPIPMERYLRLLGATLVVHAAGDPDVAGHVAPVTSVGPWHLSRLAGAPPWAAVYAGPLVVQDRAAAVEVVVQEGFDPATACVVEGALASVGPVERIGRATPVVLTDDLLVLRVEAPRDGVLVVREAWGGGWRALVDGRPAPVLPADVLFRAVPVPAGAREVTLLYEARGRSAGAAIALAAVALLLVALALERRAAVRSSWRG